MRIAPFEADGKVRLRVEIGGFEAARTERFDPARGIETEHSMPVDPERLCLALIDTRWALGTAFSRGVNPFRVGDMARRPMVSLRALPGRRVRFSAGAPGRGGDPFRPEAEETVGLDEARGEFDRAIEWCRPRVSAPKALAAYDASLADPLGEERGACWPWGGSGPRAEMDDWLRLSVQAFPDRAARLSWLSMSNPFDRGRAARVGFLWALAGHLLLSEPRPESRLPAADGIRGPGDPENAFAEGEALGEAWRERWSPPDCAGNPEYRAFGDAPPGAAAVVERREDGTAALHSFTGRGVGTELAFALGTGAALWEGRAGNWPVGALPGDAAPWTAAARGFVRGLGIGTR